MKPASSVVAQKVGDGMVLVNMETSEIFELTTTASRAWELLSDGATVDEIRETLQAEFDAPGDEQIDSELDEFLALARREDLLVEEAGAS